MEVPGLADKAHDFRTGAEQVAQRPRRGHFLPRLAGHPEGRELCVLEDLLRSEREELGVARVRAGPASLDEGEADLVELVQDAEAIVDRIAQVGALGTVTEGRVVELDGPLRVAHDVAPSTTRSPTSEVA